MASKKSKQLQRDEAYEQFEAARGVMYQHPILSPLVYRSTFYRSDKKNLCPPNGWALVTSNGTIYVHPKRYADKDEWLYILTHGLLHLGFGHIKQLPEHANQAAWNAACDVYVARFMQDLKFGKPPEEMQPRVEGFPQNEESIYEQFCEDGIPPRYQIYSTGGAGIIDMQYEPEERKLSWWANTDLTWEELFGMGLANAVRQSVDYVGGAISSMSGYANPQRSASQEARVWFMNSYPLLGALAAGFKIIEDPLLCQRSQISVAAVDAEAKEIYMNPAAGMDVEECKFVMAHELLHVALRHHARRQGRDPYLWNVACDFVINGWLMEMGIGHPPAFGLLDDHTLKGLNAEGVYDLIVTDLRRYRKLATLRGYGLGDMLESDTPDWWMKGEGCSLDDFYRRALSQGLVYHEQGGRGFLPAGLIEEIWALGQPPVPWDVELARWFDENFPPIEKVRSYARQSRRQDSTPDIPRPRYIPDWRILQGRTFGVILDTSGSMDKQLLAKALGAIASYSIAHEVHAVRVIFCDAHPYDQGYLSPEDIAGRVKIKGRGGTVLQPAIRLLETTDDFPESGPILIITDTECDRLIVTRDHAYLIPDGKLLPFPPKGPVFKVR